MRKTPPAFVSNRRNVLGIVSGLLNRKCNLGSVIKIIYDRFGFNCIFIVVPAFVEITPELIIVECMSPLKLSLKKEITSKFLLSINTSS